MKFDYQIRNTRTAIRFDYQALHKSISATCRSRYREILDVSRCFYLFPRIQKTSKKLIVIDKSLLNKSFIRKYHPMAKKEKKKETNRISHFSARGLSSPKGKQTSIIYRRNLRVAIFSTEMESKKLLANVNAPQTDQAAHMCFDIVLVIVHTFLYFLQSFFFVALVRFHPRVFDFFFHLHNL